jgi:hypothetical protein
MKTVRKDSNIYSNPVDTGVGGSYGERQFPFRE